MMVSHIRILIVEDESIVALDTEECLQRLGYRVVGRAASGEEAVQMAKEELPDLVLMDIRLKGEMDGITAAGILRAWRDIPIIFLTAFSDEATLQRASQIEPFGYILKPFEERELVVHIEMALSKHRLEKALRQSQERYELAVQGSNDGIWDWDLNTGQIFLSSRWKRILGWNDSSTNHDPQSWFERVHGDDLERLQAALTNHITGHSEQIEIEYRMLHQNGSWIWVLTRGLGLRDISGKVYRLSGSQTDITSLKLAEERLIQNAFYDSLTGLPNRSLLVDRLSFLLSQKDYQVALFYLDLDNFRALNDRLGYARADRCIFSVAQRLRNLFAEHEIVAHLYGDVFCVVRQNLSRFAIEQCASDLIAAFQEPLFVEQQLPINISVSVGVTVSEIGVSAEALLQQGEMACYQAKSAGKANWAIFDARFYQRMTRKLDLDTRLRHALESGELFVVYQPIIDLTTRHITGFEALLRWRPDGKELVPPDEFIPILEENGLIIPIGEWVLEQTCEQLKTWHEVFKQEPPLTLNVNLSPRQFHHPMFTGKLRQILENTGLRTGCLNLEITELAIIGDWEESNQIIQRLNQMGVSVHLDDFGAGYSSLSYLQRLKVQGIKLDRNFILPGDHPAKQNDSGNEIMKTILVLAKKLGMNVVAEGIESPNQLERLLKTPWLQVQGYLFFQPMPASQIDQILLTTHQHLNVPVQSQG